MQVAKYWRNNKLRYRLIKMTRNDLGNRVAAQVEQAERAVYSNALKSKQIEFVK